MRRRRFSSISRLASAITHKGPSRIGLVLVVALLLFILVTTFLDPYAPMVVTGPRNSPPSLSHLFGTDFLGRDVLSQFVWGSYTSLFLGISAAIITSLVGLLMGMLAGYYERAGPIFSTAADIALTLPPLILLMIIGSLFQPTPVLLIGCLSLILWATCSRAVRAQIRSLKTRPYVDAARTSGMSNWQIMGKTLAPKVAPIALAYFVFNASTSVVIVTALQFLGVGNPTVISWGSMLYFAQQYGLYIGDWWWILAPGLGLSLFVIGLALIAFSFEEIMNPRLRVE
jgi:peptide/nickel transport system permease protein